MFSIEITDSFRETPNIKEFAYNEHLRDYPLEGSVLPVVYPGEDEDGKITFVKPVNSEVYAQLSVYNNLTYKSTTSGFFMLDQIPANTNVSILTNYRVKFQTEFLISKGIACLEDYRPINRGDYFWLVGNSVCKIDDDIYEPSDIIVFTDDCDINTNVTRSMFKHTKNFTVLKTTYGKERGFKELRPKSQTLYIPQIDSYWKYNKIEIKRETSTYDLLTINLPQECLFEPTLRFFPKF